MRKLRIRNSSYPSPLIDQSQTINQLRAELFERDKIIAELNQVIAELQERTAVPEKNIADFSVNIPTSLPKPFPKSPSAKDVRRSLKWCYKLTRRSRSSFYPSFRFLKTAKQRAMMVIYAFNRYTDDLIDSAPESMSVEEKQALLDDWQAALDWTMNAFIETKTEKQPNEGQSPFPTLQELKSAFPKIPGVELLPALRVTADQFDIPKPVFSEVILGVRTDIEPTRFPEFEDAADYCHQVATSVGVASLAIWGTKEPLFSEKVVKTAKACGIAVQWTNIVRDLKEDLLEQNRFYIPQSELRSAGITERQLLDLMEYEISAKTAKRKKNSPIDMFVENDFQLRLEALYIRYDRFIDKQLDRIETNFLVSADLYPIIHRAARRSFGMIWDTYYRLYQKMRRNPRKILSERVRLGFFTKLYPFFRWTFFPPWRLN